jgi:hypothetical protein
MWRIIWYTDLWITIIYELKVLPWYYVACILPVICIHVSVSLPLVYIFTSYIRTFTHKTNKQTNTQMSTIAHQSLNAYWDFNVSIRNHRRYYAAIGVQPQPNVWDIPMLLRGQSASVTQTVIWSLESYCFPFWKCFRYPHAGKNYFR